MRRAPALLALVVGALLPASAALAIPDGGIELVSRPTGFGPLPFDGASYAGVAPHSLSADGCKVVFESGNDILSDRDDDTVDSVYLVDRCAPGRPITLISATAAGEPGHRDSFLPSISADGTRVAFVTRAPNLLPAGTTSQFATVVKDLTTGELIVASADDGAETPSGESYDGVISADGNAVAFQAHGAIHAYNATGTATYDDVYVRFLAAKRTVMASSKGGAPGRADRGFDVDHDGTRVVFASSTSFVATDTDTADDAYVADVSPSGTVARQLASPNQQPSHVAISQDGATVAFADDRVWVSACPASPCAAPTQVDGAPAGTNQNVWGLGFPRSAGAPKHVYWTTDRRLLAQDTNVGSDLYVATIAATPELSLPFGDHPQGGGPGAITDDLSVVVSGSPSLDLPGTDGKSTQVFALTGGQITLLSQPAGLAPRRNEVDATYAGRGALSENGRFVALATSSPALGAPFGSGEGRYTQEIVVRDVVRGVTTPVSVGPDGAAADGFTQQASIDRSGSRVAFQSEATNLVAGVTAGYSHVYVRDLATGATQLIDRKPDGSPAAGSAYHPDLSEDGAKVAFISGSPDLPGANGYDHAYVADLATGEIELADRGPTGAAGVGSATDVVLDADGSHVAFITLANNMGTSDPGYKVFLEHFGELTYVSVPESGTPPFQQARDLSIDAAGDRVSWAEAAATFGYGSDGNSHVFVRDLPTRTTALASVVPAGTPGDSERHGELDDSGKRLAFVRDGNDLRARPYLRNFETGTVALLPGSSQSAFFVSLSPDGICATLNTTTPGLVPDGPSPDNPQVYLKAVGGTCAPRPDAGQATGGSSGTAVDTTPPRISGLHMTHRRFAVRRRASAFAFTLSEDARVAIALRRGRRVVATLTRAHAKAGRNRIAFSGRIGKRKLKPGRYRATVGAVDAAGNRAARRSVRFTIVRRGAR